MNEGNFVNAIDMECIREYYTPRFRFAIRMQMVHAVGRSRVPLSINNSIEEVLQSQLSHMSSHIRSNDTTVKQRERWLSMEFRNSKTKKGYQKPYMCHLNK